MTYFTGRDFTHSSMDFEMKAMCKDQPLLYVLGNFEGGLVGG